MKSKSTVSESEALEQCKVYIEATEADGHGCHFYMVFRPLEAHAVSSSRGAEDQEQGGDLDREAGGRHVQLGGEPDELGGHGLRRACWIMLDMLVNSSRLFERGLGWSLHVSSFLIYNRLHRFLHA